MNEPSYDVLMSQLGQARIQELAALIKKARHEYYVLNAPSVSDEIYDAWIDELSELESQNAAVTDIGAPLPEVSEWKKVAHSIPMGSLNKVNTFEGMTAWLTKLGKSEPVLVTEKLDGISLHVRYVKGAFSQAITLGDGSTGEDISVNVAKMQGVLGRLQDKRFTGSLRGEIILKKADQLRFFPEMKSTRNGAGGIAKRLDGDGCQHLWVYFYQVVEGKDFDTEGEQFAWLTDQGLTVPNWYVTAMVPGVRTPHDLWLEYQQSKRDALEYEIDGLVVRLNDLAKQLAAGEHDNHTPKGAVAFKFAALTRETKCLGIEGDTAATGNITPVCVFEPVRLVGAEITRASLYNWRNIRELGLNVGARVLIARANDVIPRVVSVTRSTGTVAEPPSKCSSCGSDVAWRGEYLVCPASATCPAQTAGRIKRYVGELGIREWGDVLIDKLVGQGLVKSVPDLYRLTEGQLAGVDRMGVKSSQNVLRTLRAKNPLPLEQLLGALSIPMCATSTIKLAMDAGYDTWVKLSGASAVVFEQVDGIGPIKAASLANWLESTGQMLVPELLTVGVVIKERVRGSLNGKSFCFTGGSERPRAELEELVKAAGGEVKTSVTKKLTYLVMADPKSASTKAVAAQKNGTKCISEAELVRLAEGT